MALTRAQKEAIAWCDFAAGLATAELGPISFAIGAAASMAYYKDKQATAGWQLVVPPPGPIPSNSGNQGELHNLTVTNYLNDFPDGVVTYNQVITVASQVRPDLAPQIHKIQEDYFNTNVKSAQSADTSTVDAQLALISASIPLNADNSNTVSQTLSTIQDVDTNVWVGQLDGLIGQVDNFELSDEQKNRFKDSLQILRYSPLLWGDE